MRSLLHGVGIEPAGNVYGAADVLGDFGGRGHHVRAHFLDQRLDGFAALRRDGDDDVHRTDRLQAHRPPAGRLRGFGRPFGERALFLPASGGGPSARPFRHVEKNKSDRLDVSDGKTLKLDDEHYQEDLARIAIAQGGVYGKLPGHGQQRDFLPQAYSDFIYAIIIEETGLIGGFFVLFLYIVLMIRVAMIARKCDRLFPKYLILGCGLMIVTQALVNMAVAVGVFPVTGQPLPLISRGGTSTIISCFYIGIILSVSRFGANIGNEADDFPEEEQPEAETALAGVSQEEINNWVPGLEANLPESPANPAKPHD